MSFSLESVQEQQQLLDIERSIALNKAFKSEDAGEILKAQTFLQKWSIKDSNQSTKSILVDPHTLSASTGYRETPQRVSYDSLRGMSRIPIIRAIIETRKDQVAAFCNYTEDEYETGFKIQKKQLRKNQEQVENTPEEDRIIENIAHFILNCGNSQDKWYADTFDTFVRKIVDDSLSIDQAVFEIVPNKKGNPSQFLAVDSTTYRIADTYNAPITKENQHIAIDRCLPAYVQLIDGQIAESFYPWELCFGVRNPQTSIYKFGYGRSELEDLMQTVIALLNADQYNGNFFKVGSNPRGIIKYSGNINSTTLQDLRENWNTQVAGVNNMHKTPVINADKVDWINTHQSNRDMEYSHYQEFLIKITCAVYKIDPSEVGFNMSGSMGQQPMFESNNESRLKYSKDKGLKPLLKQIQFWLNKYVVSRLNSDYEMVFVGIDGGSRDSELDIDIKELNSFTTLNEIRKKRNMPPLENGDIPLNSTYTNYLNSIKQGEQQEQQMQQQQEQAEQLAQDQIQKNNSQDDQQQPNDDSGDNPIMKSFQEDFSKMIYSKH